VYTGTSGLRAATVFLYGEWVGAEIAVEEGEVRVAQEEQVILVPVSEVMHQ